MNEKNILDVRSRAEFRAWLEQHAGTEAECWVHTRRGRPLDETHLWYLDAVEEALCFGWIDSTFLGAGSLQRFSPRQKNRPWTELKTNASAFS